MNSMARRMFELVEPIGVIPYSADDPNEAMFALGFTNYWDTYFAGRAAHLGLPTAEVVDALFYNFAPGEVARHIPKVWRTTTPEAAIAARQTGCVKALRRILGAHVEAPAFARAAELLIKAATSAPSEGRPMYAALRALPIPDDVVARLFHAASLLREHRGDGHIAALMVEGVGGLEAHVLLALDMNMPADEVRAHPPSPGSAARRRDRGNARTRTDRERWLVERTGSRRQTAGRGAHRRPGGEALREPAGRRTRGAGCHSRAASQAATRCPALTTSTTQQGGRPRREPRCGIRTRSTTTTAPVLVRGFVAATPYSGGAADLLHRSRPGVAQRGSRTTVSGRAVWIRSWTTRFFP